MLVCLVQTVERVVLLEQSFRPDLPASAENAQRTGLSEMREHVSDLGGTLQVQSDAQVLLPSWSAFPLPHPLRLLPGGQENQFGGSSARPRSLHVNIGLSFSNRTHVPGRNEAATCQHHRSLATRNWESVQESVQSIAELNDRIKYLPQCLPENRFRLHRLLHRSFDVCSSSSSRYFVCQ